MKSDIYFSFPQNELPKLNLINTVTIDLPYIHFRRQPVDYILYIILDGVMYLTEDTTAYTLKPGDMIILDPSRVHYGRKASRCYYYYIHFQFSSVLEHHLTQPEYEKLLTEQRIHFSAPQKGNEENEVSARLLLPKFIHLDSAAFQQLEYLAHNVLISCHTPIELHLLQAQCTLLSLFCKWEQLVTDRILEKKPIDTAYLVPQIMAYLRIYYYDHLNSEYLEEHFHRSFDHMNRRFKKFTGYTIFQWLNSFRISEAKKLLAAGYDSQAQIAEKCGFSNEFYFSRVFKKFTGITPTEYKSSLSVHEKANSRITD